MKKIILILLTTVYFFNTSAFGQYRDCALISKATQASNQSMGLLAQTGGIYIPSQGTLKVLIVFARMKDDNSPHNYWTAGSPPPNYQSYIDSTTSQGSTNFLNLTNYFSQMSMGTLHVIGKAVYVETPNNKSYYGSNYYLANKEILQQKVDPLINFANYDNWTYNSNYNFTNQPDGTIDMIVVVWRGSGQFGTWGGEASLGYGLDYTVEGGTKAIKSGFSGGAGSGVTIQSNGGKWPEYDFHSMIHEVAHWLIGGVHPYVDNSYTATDEHAFWGMLRHSTEGVCTNAYERERLGWITPTNITVEISDAALSDFISTGVAYKYHPSNGDANEYYYFENHQKLNIYDDATRNSTDKGIFVLHQQDGYNSTNNIKSRTSNGDWNWQNPFYTTACYSQSLPAFRMLSANRYGLNTRDFLYTSQGNYQAIFALADNNNIVTCNGYEYGEGSVGTFNPTSKRVFAPWSNPSSHTWSNQETNFEMQILSQNSNTIHIHFYLGNMVITENTTLAADNYNFTGNLTVASGATLTIQPSATLTFVPGTSLYVNGTLNAVGNSTSPITFTRSGTTGTWGGIKFNNGSSGNLQYCTIQSGDYGISCNNSSPSIAYCRLENSPNAGVNLYYYSNPSLYYNTIQNNYSGIVCGDHSSPNMLYPGHNVIRSNNAAGVAASNYSNPQIGSSSGYGNNSIYNNSSSISAHIYCTIDAQNNYWGGGNPVVYTSGNSVVNYLPILTTDPNSGRANIAPTEISQNDVTISYSIQGGDELSAALDKLKDKKYDEAIPLFLEVFKNNKEALLGKYALCKIEECFTQAGKKDFLDYSKKELRPLIKTLDETFVELLELETHQLVNAGLYKEAMDNLFLIKDKYNLNEEIDKNTLYRIGVFYSELFGDKKNAKKYFDEFKIKYPNDDLVNDIDHWMNIPNEISNNGSYIAVAQAASGTQAAENAGVSVENYPNPFNPTTKISFSVPQKSQIRLKVFDVLGREVANLADGVYEAGKYEVSFDASKLPSGVYFYNLTTGTNSITKKMLLMK